MIEALAVWGAALSTFLAVLQARDAWRRRFRIDIGANLHSDPDYGNRVMVRNLGGYSIILTYWELVWLSGCWPFRKQTNSISPEDQARDLNIEPGSGRELLFEGPNHFDWGVRALKGRRIYIRLHIAGRRRSVLRRVYPTRGTSLRWRRFGRGGGGVLSQPDCSPCRSTPAVPKVPPAAPPRRRASLPAPLRRKPLLAP